MMANRTPRLQVLLHPVPEPAALPLARVYEPNYTNILVHPGVTTSHLINAMGKFLEISEWQQWLEAFHYTYSTKELKKVIKNPYIYLPESITSLTVIASNIPQKIRHPLIQL
ncbi:hypothetical protein [Nocardiopsis synnemataformans]|uniref:hypothetical protein n=1 Tax=Nocardiopsis synnemataformans TaxID=61305 RepID=UPI003EB81FA8